MPHYEINMSHLKRKRMTNQKYAHHVTMLTLLCWILSLLLRIQVNRSTHVQVVKCNNGWGKNSKKSKSVYEA